MEGLSVFLSVFIGDVALYQINGIPINMRPSLLFIPAWWAICTAMRLYPGWGLGIVEELRRITIGLTGMFGLASLTLFMAKFSDRTSRITFLTAYTIGMVLIPLARVAAKRICIWLKIWGAPVAVYGEDETVPRVIGILKAERGLGYEPACVFDSDSARGTYIQGVPVCGGLQDTVSGVPIAIVAMPQASRHDVIELLEGPLSKYPTVILIPDLYEAPSLWVKPRDLQGVLGLEISHNLLDPLPHLIKKIMDYALVIGLLPLWMPLLVLIAVLIRLEDGHFPFFIQPRIGVGGRFFNVIKFRTMRPNAEQCLQEALARDPSLQGEWERNFKLKRDPRITRIGRFLRVTSLDEIPQLINVLLGQMALVGPRPLPPYHYDELPQRVRRLRDRVLPGVTGMWQVSGRSDAGVSGMELWDAYYVRNWSVWLDVVILFRTVRTVLRQEGAY